MKKRNNRREGFEEKGGRRGVERRGRGRRRTKKARECGSKFDEVKKTLEKGEERVLERQRGKGGKRKKKKPRKDARFGSI